jgi:hypothetical protein
MNNMIFAALYQGLSPERPLMRKLARKQPSTLQGLMDKVEEFINQEETHKAMISSRRTQEIALEKEFKKASKEYQKPVKKFQDYNFTPLNIKVAEFLIEIKKDLEFHRPLNISGNPPPHNKDKYCDFHKAIGYHTKGCIALRLLIEKIIKKGKLIRFLGEQRK